MGLALGALQVGKQEVKSYVNAPTISEMTTLTHGAAHVATSAMSYATTNRHSLEMRHAELEKKYAQAKTKADRQRVGEELNAVRAELRRIYLDQSQKKKVMEDSADKIAHQTKLGKQTANAFIDNAADLASSAVLSSSKKMTAAAKISNS